jgi:prophage DNA circulation protein
MSGTLYVPTNYPIPGVPDPNTPIVYYQPSTDPSAPPSSTTATTYPTSNAYSSTPPSNVINAAWAQSLQQSSWRGTIFYINTAEFTTGRKLVAHEYPFSDDPDIEDLGRALRRVTFDAYLVGDDYANQFNQFEVQTSLEGPGELIHPTIGTMQANCKSASLSLSKDDGRVVIIRLEFWIPNQTPALTQTETAPDTQQDTLDSADDVDDSADEDYFVDVSNPITDGLSVVGDVGNTIISGLNTGFDFISDVADTVQGVLQAGAYIVSTVTGVVMTAANIAVGLVNDASRAEGCVQGLGNILGSGYYFGRYDNADLSTMPAVLQNVKFTGSPNDITNQAAALLITQSTNNRTLVLTAANLVPLLAEVLQDQTSSKALTAGVRALLEALRVSALSPLDGIRLLVPLCGFETLVLPGTSSISTNANLGIQATAALVRRAAISSLARALTTYQPNTTNDVQNMFGLVIPILDNEILYSADVNDKNSYSALNKLKSNVVAMLQLTAVNLPSVEVIGFQRSLPSLVLAWQIYADSSRSDELISLNNVPNPLFMPLQVEILSQ